MIIDRTIRRAFLVVLIFLYCHSSYSQSFSCYYDGYWGSWESYDKTYLGGVTIRGKSGEFIIYENREHPSKYFFKFTIPGYEAPSRKEVKTHFKANTWFVYNGFVEYYVSDAYPTFGDCLKQLKRPLLESDTQGMQYQEKLSVAKAIQIGKTGDYKKIGLKKVAKNAIIKIAPYVKFPKVYNIWFDDVGYAIDLGQLLEQ